MPNQTVSKRHKLGAEAAQKLRTRAPLLRRFCTTFVPLQFGDQWHTRPPPDGPQASARGPQERPEAPHRPSDAPRGATVDPWAGAKEEPKEGWVHLLNTG